jgi:C_GCAxxG_C_C family probable redox protein
MGRMETVVSLFNQGFNCAQALLAVYGVELGLKQETALKIASAFGGGMGRMGETCGAVTGAFMIIGLKHSTVMPNERERREVYRLVERFVERFKASNKYNSILCNELLGFDIGSKKELDNDNRRIIKERCPEYVRNAAQIIEEMI